VLGIFGKVKDKERPATPETPEDKTPGPETLQNLQNASLSETAQHSNDKATSRQSTPQTQLQYARKLNVNGVELYQLYTSNSREDIIHECIKAEALMRAQGSTNIFRIRVDFLGIPRLDKVNLKEALIDYLWTLYDLIDERVAIQTY